MCLDTKLVSHSPTDVSSSVQCLLRKYSLNNFLSWDGPTPESRYFTIITFPCPAFGSYLSCIGFPGTKGYVENEFTDKSTTVTFFFFFFFTIQVIYMTIQSKVKH